MHPTQQTSFDDLATQYLGEESDTFDSLAENYLGDDEFDSLADDYLNNQSQEDPLSIPEGADQVSSDSFLNNTFKSDESVEGQIVSMFLNGQIPARQIPDELALKASEWAKNKANEIDAIEVEPEKASLMDRRGPFDPIYKEDGKKPVMSDKTKLELSTAFKEISRYLKMDPDYADSYDRYAEQYANQAKEGWEQHDKWQEDSDNNEFPELFKKGIGESQVVPQDMLRGFMDGIPLSLVQMGAELNPDAEPVLRGSEEAKKLSKNEKEFRGRYGAYVPMFQFMGGYKRAFPKEDARFHETLSEVGGVLMQFTQLGAGNLAWKGGQQGMQKLRGALGSKVPTPIQINPSRLGNPFKAAVQRGKERMINTAAGAAGYEVAKQEIGNAGAERIDESYLVDKVKKEITAAAVNIPIMVAIGEGLHHGSKLAKPVFYKKNAEFAKKFGSSEAFKKEYNRITDIAVSSKSTFAQRSEAGQFLATIKVHAEQLGVPTEFIATGKNGFKLVALSPRKWTESIPALRRVLSDNIIQFQRAKAPKQEKVIKDAEATVKDVSKPKPEVKTEMEQLAIEAGEVSKGITDPVPPPPKPKDRVDPGLSFVSGLERSPTDAANAISGGGQIGVRINQPLSKTMIDKVVDLTQLDQNVFIEHGLYKGGEMEEAFGDSFTDITDRLIELVQNGAKPERLYVILPDALDSAFRTRDYVDLAYSGMNRKDALRDVNYIYVMQRLGAGGKFASESLPPSDLINPDSVTIGIPGNLSRVNVPELRSLFTTGLLKPHNKFHLLGVDPASQRGKDLIGVIREQMPDAIISADTALGRTSVNAVKKENMQEAAESLGLVDDIPEHESWTDWVDEIWSTSPVEQSWTPSEIKEVAQTVSYDDKEFLEIFKLLNEGQTLYEIEDHLGYEIFSYGMDKAKVQKLLEIIHPKTNRGDWIRKKAKEAQGEETPTPIAPEEPTEPVAPTEPEEEEFEVDGYGTDAAETEQVVKGLDGVDYEVNPAGVIQNPHKEMIYDSKDFTAFFRYAVLPNGFDFNIHISTPIGGTSGPVSLNYLYEYPSSLGQPNVTPQPKIVNELNNKTIINAAIDYARSESIKIVLKEAENILTNSLASKKLKKEAEKIIKEFGNHGDPRTLEGDLQVDKHETLSQDFLKKYKKMMTSVGGGKFSEFDDEETDLLIKIRDHVHRTADSTLEYLRDLAHEKNEKGKFVASLNDLNAEVRSLYLKDLPKDSRVLSFITAVYNPNAASVTRRNEFNNLFRFLNVFDRILVQEKGFESYVETQALDLIAKNELPDDLAEIKELIKNKEDRISPKNVPSNQQSWELDLKIAIQHYTIKAFDKKRTEPTEIIDPPVPEEPVVSPLEKAKQNAERRIKGFSTKTDSYILKEQRKYIVEKLDSIEKTWDDPYEALTQPEIKKLNDLQKAYQDAKSDPKKKEGHYRIKVDKYRSTLLDNGSLPYIELQVPYDGTFRIINGKTEIADFKKKIGKGAIKFRGAAKQKLNRTFTTPKPTKPVSGKGDIGKAAQLFQSKDPSRYMLTQPVQLPNILGKPYETVVSTDGRRLIFIKNPKQGKLPAGVVQLDKDHVIQNKEKGKFPPVHHIIPKGVVDGKDHFNFTEEYLQADEAVQVDVETLTTWATSCNLIAGDDKFNRVGIQKGTDGKLAMFTKSYSAVDYASANTPVKQKPLTIINSNFLVDIAKAAAELKLPIVEFRVTDNDGPVVVLLRKGVKADPQAYVIQMPIRVEESRNPYGVADAISVHSMESIARSYIRRAKFRQNAKQVEKYHIPEPPGVKERLIFKDQFIKSVDGAPFLEEWEVEWIFKAWNYGNKLNNHEFTIDGWKRMFPYLSNSYQQLMKQRFEDEQNALLEIVGAKQKLKKAGDILSGGLVQSLKPNSSQALVGKKMPDPANVEEFVRQAQILRSPYLEYSHIIGVNNGKIVSVDTSTLNSPHAASFDNFTITEFATNFDEFYVVHNHPSGDPTASVADIHAHEGFKRFSNYKGSLVLDHGEYTFASKDSRTYDYGFIEDIAPQVDLSLFSKGDDPLSGHTMDEESAMYYINEYMKRLDGELDTDKGAGYFMFYLDRKNTIRGVSREFLTQKHHLAPKTLFGEVRIKAKKLGASAVVVFEPAAKSEQEAEQQRRNINVIQDNMGEIIHLIREGSQYHIYDSSTVLGNELAFPYKGNFPVSSPRAGYGGQSQDKIGGKRSDPIQSCFQYVDAQGNVVKQEFNLEAIPPIRFPELLELYKQIKGEYPKIKKMKPTTYGYVSPRGAKTWYMALNPDIFKLTNDEAAMTFAHELGHVFDYMDEANIKRGNILGRIASKHKFKGNTLPAFMGAPITDFTMDSSERNKIRRNAEKQVEEEIQIEWMKIAKEQKIDPFKNMERQTGWKDAYAKHKSLGGGGSVPAHLDRLKKQIKKQTRERAKQLIGERLSEGGIMDAGLIHAELLDLMDWWKPIPKDADPGYRSYRQSSVELYADALSVLFNAPSELKDRAPMFWKGFFAYLETKPLLAAKIKKVWAFVRDNKASGTLKVRLAKQRERWKLQEQIIYEDRKQREEISSAPNMWRKLQVDHYDYSYGVVSRTNQAKKAGAKFNWADDPEMLWGVHPFSNNRPYMFVSKVHKEIVLELDKYSITTEDFGQYLFNTRIISETNRLGTGRSQIANEGGTTPTEARRNLLSMTTSLGSDKMQLLAASAKKFRRMFFEIYKSLYEAGMFSHKTWTQNILPNKDSYATFAVADYFMKQPWVPAGIKKQVGTFKEGMNPFPMMQMKAISALRLLEKHKAQKATVELMQNHFPDEIKELDHKMIFDRNILARKKVYSDSARNLINNASGRKQRTITLIRNGDLFEYVVPWDVAQAHKGVDPAFDGVIGQLGNLTFRKIFYPLFITYNPGFQWILSPWRDFNRTWVNLPNKVSRFRLLRTYKKLWRQSWGRIKGELSPIVQEMMEMGAIGTPFDNYAQNLYEDDNGIHQMILERFKLKPKNSGVLGDKLEKALRPISWMGGKILQIGQTFETLAKTAPYYILTRDLGVKPEEAGEFVRNYSGVPPYWRRGKVAHMSGALMPFINVAIKGYMMDLRLATGQVEGMGTSDRKRTMGLGPLSGGSGGGGKLPPREGSTDPMPDRGGRPNSKRGKRQSGSGVTASWWLKYMRSSGMWTMLKVAGSVGLLGAALKKAMDMIPSYDKDNYHCIPLGYTFVGADGSDEFVSVFSDEIPMGAKIVYFRMPMDESQKMVSKIHSTVLYEVAQQMQDGQHDGKGLESLTDFVSKQMPGLHPLLEIGPAWLEYAGGGNPIDSFRGREILSYDEDLVRGYEGAKKMVQWTWDQAGLGNFIGIDPEADTTLEFGLKTFGKQTVGRLIKISDTGKYEGGYEADRAQDIIYSKLKLSYGENTHKMLKQYNRIGGVRAENRELIMSEDEYELISDWYKEYRSYHDDAKAEVDYLSDKNVGTSKPAHDREKAEARLEKIRKSLEEFSTDYIQKSF